MADAANRAQRTAALEEKRRKLDELKKKRALRTDTTTARKAASSNLDEYIDGLLQQQQEQQQQLEQVPPATLSKQSSSLSHGEESIEDNHDILGGNKDRQMAKDGIHFTHASIGTSTTSDTHSTSMQQRQSSSVNLETVQGVTMVVSKQPHVETFTVSTQTEDLEEEGAQPAAVVIEPEEQQQQEEEEAAIESKSPDGAILATNQNLYVEREPTVLSPEQVAHEVARTDFGTFLTSASKKVERILGSTEWTQNTRLLLDSLVATGGDIDGETDNNDEDEGDRAAAGDRFVTARQLYEAGKWTASRDVTDVAWSLHHRDVFLAAYNAPRIPYGAATATAATSTAVTATPLKGGGSTAGTTVVGAGGGVTSRSARNAASASSFLTPRSGELQADGLVLVWSVSMPQRPEHVLTCASPVTKARWIPQQPHLIVGGCASGQVVVWDLRAGGRYPVQVSALTALSNPTKTQAGHFHPICGMEVTDGGAGLVTASSDGKLNFWSMSNLREPVESVQIQGGAGIACLAVAPESESLVLGDEQGSLHAVTASSAAAGGGKTKARRKQVRKLERMAEAESDEITSSANTGHFGMVTSVATRSRVPASSTGLAKGFSRGSAGLVLSTGVDWTTQLWAPAYTDAPLIAWTSHSYDSVADVQWNPQNPGIFATAGTNGTVGLWNLAQSLDEPLTDGLTLSSSKSSQGEDTSPIQDGLVMLAWSIPDGRRLAVAAGGGRVYMLTLADEVVRPKGDEDTKIVSQLVARGFLSRP